LRATNLQALTAHPAFAFRQLRAHPDAGQTLGHSGAYDPQDRDGILTEVEDPVDADVSTWVERVAQRVHPPVISFNCGVDDDLIDENRHLHERMEQAGLAHSDASAGEANRSALAPGVRQS
jgi:hypothetical protein